MMKEINGMVIMDVQEGLEMLQTQGHSMLVNRFLAAVTEDRDRSNLSFENKVIFESELGLDVLKRAGSDAFAVFFLLEATDRNKMTVSKIAKILGMSKSKVSQACYRLGLLMLGIKE